MDTSSLDNKVIKTRKGRFYAANRLDISSYILKTK